MICTSYFSNISNKNTEVSENVIPISISRNEPDWYKGLKLKSVAPTPEILHDYKSKTISEEEYTKRYEEDVLSKIDTDAFMHELSELTGVEDPLNDPDKIIALCCYETSENFCHRNLLARYLNEKIGCNIREITEKELIEGHLREKEEGKEEEKAEEKPVIEIKEEMYGSVHTHAEDMFDTGNDLTEWVLNFVKRGAKKVALTGHGSMFAYEDLKGIVAGLKKDGKIPEDFEVIPGVEIYFNGLPKEGNEQKSKHMILVAKNYDGYVDLCRVISDSSRNTKVSAASREDSEYLTPLVTMDNLKKNIRKGNVLATTACAGGVFCYDLGMQEYFLNEKFEKEKHKVGGEEVYKRYEEQKAFLEEYLSRKEIKKPDASEKKEAKRVYKETGDETLLNEYDKKLEKYMENKRYLSDNRDIAALAKKEVEKIGKKMGKMLEAEKKLTDYQATEEERYNDAKEEYRQLEEIFGKENFFFEIQNHTLPFEEITYNKLIDFALDVGNTNFITSNDTHIGDYKGSETWDKSVIKRRVERFKRFKNIEDNRGDEEEYGIKSDEELREILLKNICDHTDKSGRVYSKEEIIDTAIGNIKPFLKDCHIEFPKISIDGVNHYPKFCKNEDDKFKEEVEKGVLWRFPDGLPEGYRERIDYEVGIIQSMGFSGYHLIVQDYLKYGRLLGYLRTQEEIDNAPLSIEGLEEYIKERNIPKIGMGIGPGRGSATGSLCGYLLGITELDPLKYGLLFERFLNPSRQTMPDIDSDFKDDIRERVYEYIKARYGDECVSKVATKSYTHGKGAILVMQQYMLKEYEKEEAKKLSSELEEKSKTLSPDELEDYEKACNKELKAKVLEKKTELLATKARISKLFDAYVKEKDISMTNHPERGTKALQDMIEDHRFNETEEEMVRRAVDIAGIPATLGMHACACLISGDPLRDVIPLAWNDKNKKATTQCLYPQAEDLGLLKMDLLNIKNLSVITRIMQETNDTRISDPKEVEKILNDKDIYEKIYSAGKTLGIFQVESPGMMKMMKDFKPTCFEDIILLVAAYRPGPLAFIPEIIETKRHLEDPEHNKAPEKTLNIENPILQEILAPTYGVPIYQEQVMHIFQKIAGYSLADADNVRRYMSKKKEEPLKKEKPFFIHGDPERGIRGCVEAGLTEEEAELLFDKLVEFSKYAFNKSHAAAYALVSVFTAYQKLYYPVEFYKASLSNEMKDSAGTENPIAKYMNEMKSMGINILPPVIGKSKDDFYAEGKNIRIGYGNIKGQSYKNYNGKIGCSIMDFILNNPDVSLSAVATFIKLGMFDKCWKTKAEYEEKDRVSGSRTLMLEWLDNYGEMVKDLSEKTDHYRELLEEISDIKEELKDNDTELSNILIEKEREAENVKEDFFAKREELRSAGKIEMSQMSKVTGDSIEDTAKYRKYELDILGFPFSVYDEADKLTKHGVTTFDTFRKDDEQVVEVPAVVVSSVKKTSKNDTDYYIYTLMDSKHNIITAINFREEIKADKGIFKINYRPANDKYSEGYSVNGFRPIEDSINKEKDKEFEEALKNGLATRNDALSLANENNELG